MVWTGGEGRTTLVSWTINDDDDGVLDHGEYLVVDDRCARMLFRLVIQVGARHGLKNGFVQAKSIP